MRKVIPALLTVLTLALSAQAQNDDYDYGRPSELKGLTKVFVDTGSDLKARDKIESALKKAKLGLEFADDADVAEFAIIYRSGSFSKTVGVSNPATGAVIIGQPDYPVGKGLVLVKKSGNEKPHLVMSFDDVQNTAFERGPLTNFIRDFVKTYKKANEK